MDPQRIAEREQNAKHPMHVVKSPEQAARNIDLAIAWLDRLEDKIGLEALVDQCDNNWGGRVALVATRNYIRETQLALEGLTPGGSEFYNDPARCLDWIRARLASVTKLARERNEARAHLEARGG